MIFSIKILTALFSFLPVFAKIYVIGDSHSREFEGIYGCTILHIGPHTMHRVGRDGLSFLDLKKLGIEEGATVVYSFGEIDVRCHVGKQAALKGRSCDEVIETLAQNYVQTLLQNQSQYQKLTSIVYNVVPPIHHGGSNPVQPVFGSIEERIRNTKHLNQVLGRLCEENGMLFLDVYNAYSYEDGSLCVEFSDGNVHIDAKYNLPIQQRLYELLTGAVKR